MTQKDKTGKFDMKQVEKKTQMEEKISFVLPLMEEVVALI